MAIITPTTIAQESIAEMIGQTVATDICYTEFSSEFRQKGDTVTIRRPTTFTAEEYVAGTPPTVQGVDEGSVSVVMNHHATTDFAITSKELALSIPDFRNQIIVPAVNSIVRKIERDILKAGLAASWAFSATGGVSDFTNAAQMLSDNMVPESERFAMFSPALLNQYQQLAAFNSFNVSNADTMKTGKLGPKFGFESIQSQYLHNYTTSASGTVVAVGAHAAGSSTISVSGVTNDIIPGDSVKIGNYFYHVDSATAKSGTAQTLSLGVNLQASVAAGGSVTIVAAHKVNLWGHKKWAALVTAPLMPYIGGVSTAFESHKGLSIRVSYGVDLATKSNRISFDTIYGIKVIDPAKIVKGMAF